MNRLQKKCVIASSALHGLLAVVLLFGAALMPRQEPKPFQRITVFDARLLTDAPTQGGTPMVAPPPPTAAPPTPTPPLAEVHPTPTPPKPVQQRQPDPPKPVEPAKLPPTKRPSLNPDDMKMVSRTDSTSTTKPKKPVTDSQPAPVADTSAADRKRVKDAISSAMHSVSDDSSQSRAVDIPNGIGGGPLMANYRDLVASKYFAAWNPPPGIEDATATVQVRIVISRDGRVVHYEIVKPSGNAAMDKSIQSTLERVTFIEPFPAGSNDPQRIFPLNFNLAAKRSMGLG